MNENKIFEGVYYIKYKVTTEEGIVEGEMSSANVNYFIKLTNDLKLEEVKQKEPVKGWFISIDCYNNNREFMYNAYLIGNLFYIDKSVYSVTEKEINKLNSFIYNRMISY